MIDNKYWNNVIDSLREIKRANWAAHVLANNIEIYDEILTVVSKEKLIGNCLLCYSLDFSAQPYLDQVLCNFTVNELIHVYKSLKEKPIQTAGALMWLLEDLDPEFKWASYAVKPSTM